LKRKNIRVMRTDYLYVIFRTHRMVFSMGKSPVSAEVRYRM